MFRILQRVEGLVADHAGGQEPQDQRRVGAHPGFGGGLDRMSREDGLAAAGRPPPAGERRFGRGVGERPVGAEEVGPVRLGHLFERAGQRPREGRAVKRIEFHQRLFLKVLQFQKKPVLAAKNTEIRATNQSVTNCHRLTAPFSFSANGF